MRSDAACALNLQADAPGHVHVRSVDTNELSPIMPDLNQVFTYGFMRWLTQHAIGPTHSEHNAQDVG